MTRRIGGADGEGPVPSSALGSGVRRAAASATAALVVGVAGCAEVEDRRPAPVAVPQAVVVSPDRAGGGPYSYDTVLERANAFSATLSDEQHSELHQPYTFENAARWHTYPQWYLQERGRVGLDLRTLDEDQWSALNSQLAAATGGRPNQGYDELQQHLIADDHLRRIGAGDGYGRGDFRVAFLGTPSETDRWQLQFGGHHFALTNTYSGGALIGATPSFRGIEPRAPFEYEGVTYAPEGDELDAFTTLLGSLDAEQRAAAELTRRFRDVVLAPGADWQFPAQPEGVPVSSLSTEQRDLVLAVVAAYANDVDDANAAVILARYERELDATHLAYSGSTSLASAGDYVRIDGPSLWLELVMDTPYTTDEAHPHAVWRDEHSDYGGLRP